MESDSQVTSSSEPDVGEATNVAADESAWQVHKTIPNIEINTKTLMLRNIKTKHIFSICSTDESYQMICINGHIECYHRVIALHFIPNPDSEKYTEVNHKNHIRNDNRIENLEWCTPSDNRKDRRPYTQQEKVCQRTP